MTSAVPFKHIQCVADEQSPGPDFKRVWVAARRPFHPQCTHVYPVEVWLNTTYTFQTLADALGEEFVGRNLYASVHCNYGLIEWQKVLTTEKREQSWMECIWPRPHNQSCQHVLVSEHSFATHWETVLISNSFENPLIVARLRW